MTVGADRGASASPTRPGESTIPAMKAREPSLGSRVLVCGSGCLLAVALALAAWRVYQPPNLAGVSRASWTELDLLCSVASAICALATGLAARDPRVVVRLTFGASLLRTLSWFALTLILFAAWTHAVFLLTLLIAPSHAFACVRVFDLWRGFRAERLWRKGRSEPES